MDRYEAVAWPIVMVCVGAVAALAWWLVGIGWDAVMWVLG